MLLRRGETYRQPCWCFRLQECTSSIRPVEERLNSQQCTVRRCAQTQNSLACMRAWLSSYWPIICWESDEVVIVHTLQWVFNTTCWLSWWYCFPGHILEHQIRDASLSKSVQSVQENCVRDVMCASHQPTLLGDGASMCLSVYVFRLVCWLVGWSFRSEWHSSYPCSMVVQTPQLTAFLLHL